MKITGFNFCACILQICKKLKCNILQFLNKNKPLYFTKNWSITTYLQFSKAKNAEILIDLSYGFLTVKGNSKNKNKQKTNFLERNILQHIEK